MGGGGSVSPRSGCTNDVAGGKAGNPGGLPGSRVPRSRRSARPGKKWPLTRMTSPGYGICPKYWTSNPNK
jgi:hypothetical protein